MPTRIIYDDTGDQEAEQMLKDDALNQQFILHQNMKFQNLKQDQRLIHMVDGSTIQVQSCFGNDTITIYCPPPALKLKPIPRCEQFLYVYCFIIGSPYTYSQTVWDCKRDKRISAGLQDFLFMTGGLPALWTGATDTLGTFKATHFNGGMGQQYPQSIDYTNKTVTFNPANVDFLYQVDTNFGLLDMSVHPGDYLYSGTGKPWTKILAVPSSNTIRVSNISNFTTSSLCYIGISLPMFYVKYFDVYTERNTIQGCTTGTMADFTGVTPWLEFPDSTKRPETWSGPECYGSCWVNDIYHHQVCATWGNIFFAQNRAVDKNDNGMFKPINSERSANLEAELLLMSNQAYSINSPNISCTFECVPYRYNPVIDKR